MHFFVIKAKHILFGTFALLICGFVIIGGADYVNEVYNSSQREIPIYSVDTGENKIAITFDCAWNADDIDSIIATLEKYNCKATFFAVGDWIEKYSDAVKKLSDNGHEIANHSYAHGHFNSFSKEQMIADMDKCDALIEKITGTKPILFRAPYGEYNDLLVKTCKETGRYYIQWSVDSLDWKSIPKEDIYKRCTQKTKNGDIILLHNGTKYTAEILPQILETLSKNYEFVKVSDLIYKDNYTINVEGRQKSNN